MSRTELPRPVTLVVEALLIDIAGERSVERAVDGVDLRVAPSTVHAVIGESGSGKSTALRAIAGTLPPAAVASGSIALLADGSGPLTVPLNTPSQGSLLPATSPLAGRVIATVPQSAATALNPVRTFGDQLAETCTHLRARRTVDELIAAVGLKPNAAHLYPHELSGGMAQRAAFALAVAGDPALLLADEPTSALDPELTEYLLGQLRSRADHGGTVLLVTHDIEELERAQIADEISVMYRGRVVETGSATRVLATPEHPYTRLLLDALPSRGLHFPTADQLRDALAQAPVVTR